jgi:flagellar protein FlgJ
LSEFISHNSINGFKTISSSQNLSSVKNDDEANLAAVADQFEAIFLENLLKQARESKLSDSLFETNADDNFVEMFDKEIANTSSKLVDIGIAEAIIRQMSLQKNGDPS